MGTLEEGSYCSWPTVCGQSKGERNPDVLASLPEVARRAVVRFNLVFFPKQSHSSFPYQTCMPLGVRGKAS